MFFGPLADIDGHNRETLGSGLEKSKKYFRPVIDRDMISGLTRTGTGTGTEIINLPGPGPGPIISILPGPGPGPGPTIQFDRDDRDDGI